MYFSKYNIYSKIENSDNYFIVNLLSGNADILNSEQAIEISNINLSNHDEWIEKGYLIDESKEKILFNQKYLDFIDNRETDEVQIFFVPWYSCNFACQYCYQEGYTNQPIDFSHDIIDSFFSYVNNKFSNRKKYITLFGGEPLLKGNKYEEYIKYFLNASINNNIDVAIVTNGYYLMDYIDVLKGANIREIQVTLDGTQEVHDRRRILHNGKGTFNRIVQGIDLSLENKININLRIVIDKENLENLPAIAQYAIDKNWTKNPHFKSQIGRNYELHICQSNRDKLFTRIELYNSIYNLILNHLEILDFHKPAFSISKFLSENGELPDPLFDSCPGCKTEWAFDYTGRIYSCTATVGKSDEVLGTFYPNTILNNEQIDEWQERDITSIDQCADCNVQLACGGGCAAVAKHKTGMINSPDCRPVKELLEMGISLYFEKNT